MTDDELDDLLDCCLSELQRKQDVLTSSCGLGTFSSFWFDQPSGTLEFRDRNGQTRLTAKAMPVGSHSRRSGTWMWAWANKSILPELRQAAERLQQLSSDTGVSAFSQPTLTVADAETPWELTAFAVHYLGAIGAYKVPGDLSDLYLAICSVERPPT